MCLLLVHSIELEVRTGVAWFIETVFGIPSSLMDIMCDDTVMIRKGLFVLEINFLYASDALLSVAAVVRGDLSNYTSCTG